MLSNSHCSWQSSSTNHLALSEKSIWTGIGVFCFGLFYYTVADGGCYYLFMLFIVLSSSFVWEKKKGFAKSLVRYADIGIYDRSLLKQWFKVYLCISLCVHAPNTRSEIYELLLWWVKMHLALKAFTFFSNKKPLAYLRHLGTILNRRKKSIIIILLFFSMWSFIYFIIY